jgi:hypothetical protein
MFCLWIPFQASVLGGRGERSIQTKRVSFSERGSHKNKMGWKGLKAITIFTRVPQQGGGEVG